MSDTTNKIFDAALGAISQANEVWKKNLNDLIEKGKMSREEGDSLLVNLEKKIKEGQKQYEDFAKNAYDNVSKSFTETKTTPAADPYTNILEERVKSLEIKISLLIRELAEVRELAEKKQTKRRTKSK